MEIYQSKTSEMIRLMLDIFMFQTVVWYGSDFEVELFCVSTKMTGVPFLDSEKSPFKRNSRLSINTVF